MDDAMLEHVPCDLCGCSTHKVLFRKKDTTSYWRDKCIEDPHLDVETEFPIVQCGRCSHVYVNPRLRQEINSDIYARLWRTSEPAKLQTDDYSFYVCRQLAAMAGLGKLLDFGCGWGMYLAAARSVGWDAVGIEVDSAKIDFLSRHGLEAVQGDLLDRLFADSSFDAVIAQQVFEHLYDPLAYLEEIRRILKPGGILFISVPNYGGLKAKLRGASWHMISPIAHVRYFTSKTLSRCLTGHGFSIVRKRHLKRFSASPLQDAVYQALVFMQNSLGVYPHRLEIYGRKK
jgi:SAM-dependent methyltransferase